MDGLLVVVLVVVFVWLAGLQARAKAETRSKKCLQNRVAACEDSIDAHSEWHSTPEGYVTIKTGMLSKGTEDAACYDVHSLHDYVVNPGEQVLVASGLCTEMRDCDAFLWDRSGLAAKFRVTRRAGVIDEKYPEEWGVVLVNEGRLPYKVMKGDRVCQVHFVPKFHIEVSCDPNGDGGVFISGKKRISGFGSTGA